MLLAETANQPTNQTDQQILKTFPAAAQVPSDPPSESQVPAQGQPSHASHMFRRSGSGMHGTGWRPWDRCVPNGLSSRLQGWLRHRVGFE